MKATPVVIIFSEALVSEPIIAAWKAIGFQPRVSRDPFRFAEAMRDPNIKLAAVVLSQLGQRVLKAFCSTYGKRIAAVALSHTTDRTSIDRALAAGARDVFCLPLDAGHLADRLSLWNPDITASQPIRSLVDVPPSGADAVMSLPLEILTITPSGLSFAYKTPIAKGTELSIDTLSLPQELGLPSTATAKIESTETETLRGSSRVVHHCTWTNLDAQTRDALRTRIICGCLS